MGVGNVRIQEAADEDKEDEYRPEGALGRVDIEKEETGTNGQSESGETSFEVPYWVNEKGEKKSRNAIYTVSSPTLFLLRRSE